MVSKKGKRRYIFSGLIVAGIVAILTLTTTNVNAATGDDCSDPIVVNIPGDLTYTDSYQTTCGRVNDYSTTCLNYYDGGEDIIYRLDVTIDTQINITMDPKGTTWTGLMIDNNCPGSDGTCIDYDSASSGVRTLTDISLTAGNSYYIMVDTWPSPTCIPDFNLTITGIITGSPYGPPAQVPATMPTGMILLVSMILIVAAVAIKKKIQ